MKTRWRNLSLPSKLHLTIQLALLFLLPLAHIAIMRHLEREMMDYAVKQAENSATQAFLSLNSMMLTGMIRDQTARAVFLHKMRGQDDIEDFHLVRRQPVQDQFGPGLDSENRGDELDKLAAQTSSSQIRINDKALNERYGKRTMRVVVPFSARTDFHGVNCMVCHEVAEGTVLGTVSLTVNIEPRYRQLDRLSRELIAGQIILQLLLYLVIGGLIRHITRPVTTLTADILSIEQTADFTRRSKVSGNDEIGVMAKTFNGLVERIEGLHRSLAEKLKVLEEYQSHSQEELRISSNIMGRITNTFSCFDPAVSMIIIPISSHSGDVVLLARTPANNLHILIADAVGHGLIASINLLPISQTFNAMSKKGFPITSIAEKLNESIHQLMPADRFISTALVSIDFREQTIEVWNGGLPKIVLLDRAGEILHSWTSRYLPMGLLPKQTFSAEVETFHYRDACQLFLYSDGLTEAESEEGRQFGEDKLFDLMRRHAPQSRFDAILKALKQHLGERSAHDDISLAMVDIEPWDHQEAAALPPPVTFESMPQSHWKMALELGPDELRYLDTVPLLTQLVGQIRTTAAHQDALYIILSELYNNALEHGVLQLDSEIKQGPNGFEEYLRLRELRLNCLLEGSIEIVIEQVDIEGGYGLKIQVTDSGLGFDHSPKDYMLPNQFDRRQHGRGMDMVRSLSYRFSYSSKGNVATAYYICG